MTDFQYEELDENGGAKRLNAVEKQRRFDNAVAVWEQQHNRTLIPVRVSGKGRNFVKAPLSKAWCSNVARYADQDALLGSGRTLLNKGYLFNLEIAPGLASAVVYDQQIRDVSISMQAFDPDKWVELQKSCARNGLSSTMVLSGKLDESLLSVICDIDNGLFPQLAEIRPRCNCLEEAFLCRHASALMYALAVAFDTSVSDLFTLRGVDFAELAALPQDMELDVALLSQLFGIDIVAEFD